MSTKKPSASSAPGQADVAAAQTGITDMTRQQLALSADTMSAVFSASQAIQEIQQQMAERAALRHQQAAEQLRNTSNPAEMMAVQFDLLTFSLLEAARYWPQVAAATMQTQAETVASAGRQQASTATAGLNPMFQAWQSMLTSPMNAMNGASAQSHH